MLQVVLAVDRLHVHALHGLPLVTPGLLFDPRYLHLTLDRTSIC